MRRFTYFIMVIFILLLSGCNQSEEEVKKTSITQTKQAFEDEPKEPNEKTEKFSFYLPEDFEIDQKNKYNVILEKGNNSYILFVNKKEKENSKVSYQTLMKQYKDPFISETFEQNNQFGYLFVVEIDKNKYEMTVGIGGVKVTTVANEKGVVEDTLAMMNIVHSVK